MFTKMAHKATIISISLGTTVDAAQWSRRRARRANRHAS